MTSSNWFFPIEFDRYASQGVHPKVGGLQWSWPTCEITERLGYPTVCVAYLTPYDVFLVRYIPTHCGLEIEIMSLVNGDKRRSVVWSCYPQQPGFPVGQLTARGKALEE